MVPTRILPLLAASFLVAVLLATTGCQSRAASAQKLFEQGKYEDVLKQYPDLEIAQRAHVKLADKYLEAKQYDVVLKDYADTRAAYQARLDLADQMVKAGRYQAVLDSFPGTPAATMAKETLADSLYKAGAFDLLIARFPDTPQATQLKEQRSQDALTAAKKLRGDAKKQALESLMKNYSGTAAYKEAAQLLADIRQKEQSKKK
jgi:transposase